MSLILDALKQAEHERGHDRAPELFGPTIGAAAPLPTAAPAPRWPWALAATALLAGAGALAWQFWPRLSATAQVPQTATPSSAPAGTALFVPPAAKPAPIPAPITAQTIVQATATAPTLAPAGPMPPAAPVAVASPVRPEPAPSALPNAAPPPPPDAQPPAATELPAEARARLPGLNITGHTYSDNPTLRMLMIDGRMFVEGQAVQPGLRLERIGPHRAVFNHQGTRFGVDY